MSYIEFDKLQLINLEYILSKELLRSNRAGAFSSTTIIGCNTRKYHGLLIVRQPDLDGEHHVLLSMVDETIIQQETAFNMGVHRFKGGYFHPKGHKYLREYLTEPIPKLTFRVGGVFLTKEMLFTHDDDRVIIKYTLEDAHSPTTLRLKPFLAFRSRHSLSKANVYAETRYEQSRNGISMKLYNGYSPIHIQLSQRSDYVHVPHWYYDLEYLEELERGYEYLEDLLVPGYFEVPIKKGQSIYFSAGLEDIDPVLLQKMFEDEVKRRIPRNNFENCLVNSAHQFVTSHDQRAEIVAGFPWYNPRTRDALIALPGLTLYDDRESCFLRVMDTLIASMRGPFFPAPEGRGCLASSADEPLWLIWALQQFVIFRGKKAMIWKKYGSKMKEILQGYRTGYCPQVAMQADGLIEAYHPGVPLTWMDAMVEGQAVIPRYGKAVEVNALWYNALRFVMEMAGNARDKAYVAEWEPIARMVLDSFVKTFWNQSKGYLADTVFGDKADFTFRPNQLFAVSLPHSPVTEETGNTVIKAIKSELLTPRGLRTLSPKDPNYVGIYQGDTYARDRAAHQGSVWPWLLAPFTEAYLKINGKSGLPFIQKLYAGLEPTIREHGLGSISEIYDGDPPHHFGGAISMAWSVGEVLRMKMIMNQVESHPS